MSDEASATAAAEPSPATVTTQNRDAFVLHSTVPAVLASTHYFLRVSPANTPGEHSVDLTTAAARELAAAPTAMADGLDRWANDPKRWHGTERTLAGRVVPLPPCGHYP